jgi:hypothetical protein
MIRLLCAASLPLLLPVLPQGDDEDGQDAPNVLRLYDLGALELGQFEVSHSHRNTLLPFVRGADEVDYHEEGDDGDKGEHFVNLLTDLYGGEFEYEGRMLDITEDGMLVVLGPEALHGRVERLYAFYEATLNSQAVLQLEVLSLRATEGGPNTALLDVAGADALAQQARQAGGYRAFSVPVRADRTVMIDASRSVSLLLDYDIELAQGAAIGDPIVYEVSAGSRLHLQAAPVADGLALALTWKHGELVSDNRREIGLSASINTESGKSQVFEVASRMQGYKLANRSAGFGCMLPRGKVLALRASTDQARGATNEVVLIRQVSGGLTARAEFALSPSSKLVLADTGSAVPPAVRAGGSLLYPNTVPPGLPPTGMYTAALLTSNLRESDHGLVLDLMQRGEREHVGLSEIGRWAVLLPIDLTAGEDGEAIAREQAEALATLGALAADMTQFGLELTVLDGRARVASATLPLRNGTGAVVTLGMESAFVRDLDVEVAQFAAIPDPHVGVSFDGLALYVKPTLTARGTLLLDVRGGANLVRKLEEFDLGTDLFRFIDQPSAQHVFVHQRRDVAAASDGSWSTVFGDTAGEGVQLEVRLTRL